MITYESNPVYKARILRHKRRGKERKLDYIARSLSGEYFILRAMMVMHKALRIERDVNKGMSFRAMMFLLMAKQYLTITGKSWFTAHEINRYSRHILDTNYSFRSSLSYAILCEGLFYLNPLANDKTSRRRYVLSMKARALFRELEQEFKSDYDVMSYLHKDKV
jgi:hypothetical protein